MLATYLSGVVFTLKGGIMKKILYEKIVEDYVKAEKDNDKLILRNIGIIIKKFDE